MTISPLWRVAEGRAALLFRVLAARSCWVFCQGWDTGALLLGARIGLQVLDVICRFLGLRCRMDEQGRLVAQDRIQLWR